jgi:serine/threonine-protein phosphatase PGAM5
MPQRRLYLVRHGQYDLSAMPQDNLGGGLTPMGIQQAELTATRFGVLPIDAVIHSGLRRAHETAAIIVVKFPGLVLRSSELLRECTPGIPVGYAESFSHLTHEAIERELQQAEAAFDEFFVPAIGSDRHEIIVCHGNIIRYFILRVLRAPTELWANPALHHCGISELWVEADGQVRLVSHNDTGHLPYTLRTL